MPKLIWVFAGCTVILLVSSRGSSFFFSLHSPSDTHIPSYSFLRVVISKQKRNQQNVVRTYKEWLLINDYYVSVDRRAALSLWVPVFYHRQTDGQNLSLSYPALWRWVCCNVSVDRRAALSLGVPVFYHRQTDGHNLSPFYPALLRWVGCFVKIWKIWTPEKIAVILKFEQYGFNTVNHFIFLCSLFRDFFIINLFAEIQIPDAWSFPMLTLCANVSLES